MAKGTTFQNQPLTGVILAAIVLVCVVALLPTALELPHRMLQIAIVLVGLFFLLWVFLERLRHFVFSPLASLASQAKYITIYKDYSLRLYRPEHLNYPLEVSALYDAHCNAE